MNFNNKKIILIMPPDFGVYKLLEENLKNMGFEQITVLAPSFQYKFKDRVLNFVKKSFFHNKEYKKQLIDSHYAAEIHIALSNFTEGSVDYAIVIRPDKLDVTTIKRIHTVAHKVVAYQWDGLMRFPKVFKVISLFKRFFVFDPDDYYRYNEQYPNLLPCTNFYFDTPEEKTPVNKGEVIYVGVYIKNRVDSLLKIVEELSKNRELTLNINLFLGRKTPPFVQPYITFLSKGISYTETLTITKKADILLDVKTVEHNGLSFRIFEAIKYEKKLITDNSSVKQYDFYQPNNIFVFENNSFEGINDFLKSEYMPLAKEIKEKYSFGHWVKEVLEILK